MLLEQTITLLFRINDAVTLILYSQSQGCEEATEECSTRINEQASYAVNKLRQLNDKLEYKKQALNSICNSPKPDKKVTTFSVFTLKKK